MLNAQTELQKKQRFLVLPPDSISLSNSRCKIVGARRVLRTSLLWMSEAEGRVPGRLGIDS